MSSPLQLALAILTLPSVVPPDLGNVKVCKAPLVEITVSPVVSKKSVRVMDVSWEVEGFRPGDWVGLYEGPPSRSAVPVFRAQATGPQGWLRTGREEGRTPQEPVYNRTCSRHWVAYWRANRTDPLAVNCLGTQPRWMEENRPQIENLEISDMFLPGTHDSGSFILSSSPFRENRYQKYVYTQDETVLDQLLHGARYLDFRVGHYRGVFWLNHDVVRVHPLEYPLNDLKEFLRNTKEIVVLDLHRFPVGFKEKKVHDSFVAYLKKELGEWMAPGWLGWDASLREIWTQGKRLVVAYNNREVVAEHREYLWPPVSQKWGNVLEMDRLREYFSSILEYRPRYPWAAMAQLTPTVWTVITDKQKGLRRMADDINHNVTAWFRGDWGGLCNSVAVDFLRSTGVVEAAIRWNRRRAKRTSCDY